MGASAPIIYFGEVSTIKKHPKPAITSSKLTKEALEQGVKYVQS